MDHDIVKLPETPSADGSSDESWTFLDEPARFEEAQIVEEDVRCDSRTKQDDSELSSNKAVLLNESTLNKVDGQCKEK